MGNGTLFERLHESFVHAAYQRVGHSTTTRLITMVTVIRDTGFSRGATEADQGSEQAGRLSWNFPSRSRLLQPGSKAWQRAEPNKPIRADMPDR
jgi:hypothetical protein